MGVRYIAEHLFISAASGIVTSVILFALSFAYSSAYKYVTGNYLTDILAGFIAKLRGYTYSNPDSNLRNEAISSKGTKRDVDDVYVESFAIVAAFISTLLAIEVLWPILLFIAIVYSMLRLARFIYRRKALKKDKKDDI